MSLYTYSLRSDHPLEIINIDHFIGDAIRQSKLENGLVTIYSPHTTAGITINENSDPKVLSDLSYAFNILSPKRVEYQHFEGNSHAHLLSSLVGASETLIVDQGRLVLGTWQSVFFCEFDGPRNRQLLIKVIEG